MKKMISALGVGLIFTTIFGWFIPSSSYYGIFGLLYHIVITLIIPSAVSAALLYAYRSQVVSLLKLNIDASDDEDEEDAQETRKTLFILSSIFLGVTSSGLFNAYNVHFIYLIDVVLTVAVVFGAYTLLQRSKTDSDSDF